MAFNKEHLAVLAALALFFPLRSACGGERPTTDKPAVVLLAAAASLQRCLDESLIPLFQKRHPGITVEATYDASGKLRTQIENGLAADVFLPAATEPMDALRDKGYIDPKSIVELLENRIVLVKPAGSNPEASSFADAPAAAGVLALGDPDSVPAGQYAREIFTSLGVWKQAEAKASLATNVTQALAWVAEGSADFGVVYATDAAANAKVAVVCEAPPGSLKRKVIYPVGVLAGSRHPESAGLFANFLASPEAGAVFEDFGFSPPATEQSLEVGQCSGQPYSCRYGPPRPR